MSEPITPQGPVASQVRTSPRVIESSPIEDPISKHVSGEDSEDSTREEIEDITGDNADSTLDPPDPSLSLAAGWVQSMDVRTYMTRLCSCTEDQAKYGDVSTGVDILATDVQGLPIEAGQPEDGPDLRTHILVVYVWLAAVLKSAFDGVSQTMPIATELGSWSLCAHATLPKRLELPWTTFMSAITCCEEKLGKKEAFLKWVEALPYFPKSYQSVDQIANEYLQVLDTEGVGELVWLILEKERESETSMGRKSAMTPELDDEERERRLLAELLYILASMDEHLLKAVIQGRVFKQRAIRNHPVQKALQRLESMKSQPSISINGIADHMGVSPAPYHWAEVCGHMRLYLEDGPHANRLAEAVDQLVNKVDTWSAASAEKGLRRYTDFASSNFATSPTVNQERRQTVRYFIAQMESRIATETQNGRCHVPFDAPVMEIGYSINPQQRLKEHRMHKSSNYIMDLADAMYKHLYPGLVLLQQTVIYPCFRPAQPLLAEVIFTQIAQGYVSGGRGFSHFPAGFANTYWQIPNGGWEKYAREATKDGELQRRVEQAASVAEEQRRRAEQEAQDAEEAELKRLQRTIDL